MDHLHDSSRVLRHPKHIKRLCCSYLRCRAEIHRLQKENRQLRKALADLRQPDPYEAPIDRHSDERHRTVILYGKRTYFGYLLMFLRMSLPYRILRSLFSYIRRYRTAVLVVQLVLFFITFSKNGILFLIGTAGVAVLLPILPTAMMILLQQVGHKRRREQKRLQSALKSCKHLYIFALPRTAFKDAGIDLLSFYTSLARDGHIGVLLVSPFPLSPRAIGEKKRFSSYYAAAKELSPCVFLIRGSVYYGLKNLLLPTLYESRTVFY